MNAPIRQPHAAKDVASRHRKARKIEHLLALDQRAGTLRLLEVGTGAGGISHYFGTHPSGRFQVDSVDVTDTRTVCDGYQFSIVADTNLPFENGSFDVVISNHVIEHVGDIHAQQQHLAEIKRVLAPAGVGYIAVPNRWMLIEPHYRLPFLSWLPRAWRTPYLVLMKRGRYYDCEPLSLQTLEALLQRSGLDWVHLEAAAIHALSVHEVQPSWAVRLAHRLPARWIDRLRPLIPTLICRLTHPSPKI